MISFKTFLAESKSAPLYHATAITAIPDIVRDGLHDAKGFGTTHFSGMRSASRRLPTVSTSRSYKKVMNYAAIQFPHDLTAVIVLDQNKLNQKFKVVPYDYYQTMKITGIGDSWEMKNADRLRRSEAEEVIILTQKNPKILAANFIEIILPHPTSFNQKQLQNVREFLEERNVKWRYPK